MAQPPQPLLQPPGLARIKIFADGASLAAMMEAARDPRIAGFINVTPDLLVKLALHGKDLGAFSLETVQMFHRDAEAAGYEL